MNTSSDAIIRKFNPGTFQSDKDIIEQFVVRKRELDIVLDTLRGNIESASCQHMLIVAPRGGGKTMLLARVAAELNADNELSECLLPVRFMEESHEIFDLADFWLETLFYLSQESAEHDLELAKELQDAHADLVKRWGEETLADRVRATVLDAADRLGKKLVLMIENMQDLCENVDDDFGWQLRGELQSEPQIMLLATATNRFRDLDDAQQPFFELLQTIDLKPLNTEECRRLWQVVSGDEAIGREIRPLEILTGGSPRLLVIIADFAQRRSLHQLMEDLVQLIDDHTEYFRGHLEALAKTERRVYLAAIDLWQPSSTGEIAARARMDVRSVSALLGRLVDRGMVIVDRSGTRRLYVAAERMYCLYYKLRRERDEAAVVQNLIHFMAVFYSEGEVADISPGMMEEAKRHSKIQRGIERAIAEKPDIVDLFPGIAKPRTDRVPVPDMAGDNECIKRLLAEIAAMFRKAERHKKAGDFAEEVMLYDQLIGRFSASDAPDFQVRVAWALVCKGDAQRTLNDFTSAIATYEDVIKSFGENEDTECLYPVSWALIHKGNIQYHLGNLEDAIVNYQEVVERFGVLDDPELQTQVALALSQQGDAYMKLGDFDMALEIYDEVIVHFGESDDPECLDSVAWTLLNKGDIYKNFHDFEAAIATYEKLIEQFGDTDESENQFLIAWALCHKGDAQEQLDNLKDAILTYDEIIMRFSNSDDPELQLPITLALCQKGDAYKELGDWKEAIVTYDEVIARFNDIENTDIQLQVAWILFEKEHAQVQLGDFISSIATCNEIITRFSNSDTEIFQIPIVCALFSKGMMQLNMGNKEEALHTYGEFVRKSNMLSSFSKINCALRAIWLRPGSLPIQDHYEIAASVLRFVYDLFVPGERFMTDIMQSVVFDMIEAGAPRHKLLKVLSSDITKANVLRPLIIALRQYDGEMVRAPLEILEVSADIRKTIAKSTLPPTIDDFIEYVNGPSFTNSKDNILAWARELGAVENCVRCHNEPIIDTTSFQESIIEYYDVPEERYLDEMLGAFASLSHLGIHTDSFFCNMCDRG